MGSCLKHLRPHCSWAFLVHTNRFARAVSLKGAIVKKLHFGNLDTLNATLYKKTWRIKWLKPRSLILQSWRDGHIGRHHRLFPKRPPPKRHIHIFVPPKLVGPTLEQLQMKRRCKPLGKRWSPGLLGLPYICLDSVYTPHTPTAKAFEGRGFLCLKTICDLDFQFVKFPEGAEESDLKLETDNSSTITPIDTFCPTFWETQETIPFTISPQETSSPSPPPSCPIHHLFLCSASMIFSLVGVIHHQNHPENMASLWTNPLVIIALILFKMPDEPSKLYGIVMTGRDWVPMCYKNGTFKALWQGFIWWNLYHKK